MGVADTDQPVSVENFEKNNILLLFDLEKENRETRNRGGGERGEEREGRVKGTEEKGERDKKKEGREERKERKRERERGEEGGERKEEREREGVTILL